MITKTLVTTLIGLLSALLARTGSHDLPGWLQSNSDQISLAAVTIASLVNGYLAHRHIQNLPAPGPQINAEALASLPEPVPPVAS